MTAATTTDPKAHHVREYMRLIREIADIEPHLVPPAKLRDAQAHACAIDPVCISAARDAELIRRVRRVVTKLKQAKPTEQKVDRLQGELDRHRESLAAAIAREEELVAELNQARGELNEARANRDHLTITSRIVRDILADELKWLGYEPTTGEDTTGPWCR